VTRAWAPAARQASKRGAVSKAGRRMAVAIGDPAPEIALPDEIGDRDRHGLELAAGADAQRELRLRGDGEGHQDHAQAEDDGQGAQGKMD
jgi:hypothetical protein